MLHVNEGNLPPQRLAGGDGVHVGQAGIYLIRKPSCSLVRIQAATVPMWISSWT